MPEDNIINIQNMNSMSECLSMVISPHPNQFTEC